MNKLLVVAALAMTMSFSTVIAGEHDVADNNVIYIDVRTWAEHQIDHIDGDLRIHFSEIVAGVEQQALDKKTSIKLYCEKGVRAEKALNKLIEAGYSNVENIGGIDQARQSRFDEHSDGDE